MQSVLHEAQEELQAIPLRPPAEGEREAAKIIVMAEGTSGMVELPMEFADVDEMLMLNEKLAMRACGVDEGDEMARENLPKL